MANGGGGDARERLLGVMLDKVSSDVYPSSTMLDLIERILQPDDVDAYVAILSEKIAADTYPSMSLVRRLLVLVEG
jgi:hypothetical protein